MSEAVTLKALARTRRGTRTARALRETGRIPGIIYGHGEAPEPVSLDRHEFAVALMHGQRTVSLDLAGRTVEYLIKAVQYDHLGIKPTHVDLMRVAADERVHAVVSVELRGTPKGASEGGILDQQLQQIEVDCLALSIPDTLHPNVSHLGIDESLLAKDIELPEGVTLMTDPEERVATLRAAVEHAAEEEEGEATTAEPERIGRAREDQAEGAGG